MEKIWKYQQQKNLKNFFQKIAKFGMGGRIMKELPLFYIHVKQQWEVIHLQKKYLRN